MPYSPPQLRGYFYPTPLTQRCPNYHRCCRCLKCNHYNVHSATCRQCESRAPGIKVCGCTDEQQVGIIRVEELVGRPLFDPNAEGVAPVTEQVCETSFNPDGKDLVSNLLK